MGKRRACPRCYDTVSGILNPFTLGLISESGSGRVKCPKCRGDGSLRDGKLCYTCNGDGTVECRRCDGSGYIGGD